MRHGGIAGGMTAVVGLALLAGGIGAAGEGAGGAACVDPGFWQAAPPWSGDPGFWAVGGGSPEAIDPGFWPERPDPSTGAVGAASPVPSAACGPLEGWDALPTAIVSIDGDRTITTVVRQRPAPTPQP